MGYVTVDPSYVNEFNNDIQTLAVSTRLQEGCLFYVTNLDDKSTGRMLVAERWQDKAALTSHLKRDETVMFLNKWGNMLKNDVRIFDASNEQTLMD